MSTDHPSRPFSWSWILLTLLFLSEPCFAAIDSSEDPHQLVGARVNVELKQGKTLRNVLIAEATPGEKTGTVAKLRVVNTTTRAHSVLGATAVERVTTINGICRLIFDDETKALIAYDPKLREASRHADEEQRSRREAEADEEPEAEATEIEPEQPRLTEKERKEYFDKHGVWPWPELTATAQEKEVAKQRDYLKKVRQKFSNRKMHLYETDYFLFLTDLPASKVKPCTANLDDMYSQLCKAFNVTGKARKYHFLGKVVFIAFENGQDFKDFEKEFFSINNTGAAQGLSHMTSDGLVLISCFYGNDANYFAHLLVHETTHGFMHRYRTYRALPNWLDEGIAEWLGMNVVKKNHGIKLKQDQAKARMRRDNNLGGNFFTVDHIHGEQYGMAVLIADYLIKKDRSAFRELIDSIKAGVDWREALKNTYGLTTDELTQQFGKSIGLPNLKP